MITNRVVEVARPANLSKKVGGLTRDGDPENCFPWKRRASGARAGTVAVMVLLTAVDGRRVRRHLQTSALIQLQPLMSAEPAPVLFFFAVDGADDARGRALRPAVYMGCDKP